MFSGNLMKNCHNMFMGSYHNGLFWLIFWGATVDFAFQPIKINPWVLSYRAENEDSGKYYHDCVYLQRYIYSNCGQKIAKNEFFEQQNEFTFIGLEIFNILTPNSYRLSLITDTIKITTLPRIDIWAKKSNKTNIWLSSRPSFKTFYESFAIQECVQWIICILWLRHLKNMLPRINTVAIFEEFRGSIYRWSQILIN